MPPTAVTNEAEQNVITTRQMVRIREIDFVRRFTGTILKKLMEALGVTRKIALQEGTTLYYYTTVGTLEDGNVPEGEIIPLSNYERVKTPIGEMTLRKWRKATTAEAILKNGYTEAVIETDKKLLQDIQTTIRTDFFTSLKDIDSTVVGDSTLQAVLAKTWGQLQVLFENDAIEVVHFINPLTIAGYLATANITVQTAFGFNYIQDFLGLGTVIMNSQIAVGSVISTAKDNLIMYYIPVSANAMQSFGLRSDETGYIGIKAGLPREERAQIETLAMSGIRFLVEQASGVVFGQIDGTPTLGAVTVTSSAGTAVGDSNITMSGYTLGANEKFVYKTGVNAPSVSYGQKLGSTWTELESGDDITPTATHTKITVAAVDSNGRAQAAGNTTLTVKS